MPKGKDKDRWERAFELALRTTVRALSPHVPLELPSGIKKVGAKANVTPSCMRIHTAAGVTPPLPDYTLDEIYQECVQNGVPRDKAAEHLFDELLTGALVIPSGESVGRFWEEGGKLCAESTDGRRLDPATLVTREGIAPISSGKVARLRAQLAAEERERELVKALRPARSPPSPFKPAPAVEPKEPFSEKALLALFRRRKGDPSVRNRDIAKKTAEEHFGVTIEVKQIWAARRDAGIEGKPGRPKGSRNKSGK